MKTIMVTGIVVASLTASCGGCDDTVVASALSPDGHFLAVLGERDCGATTNFARSIQISSTEKSTTWERAQVFWDATPVVTTGRRLVTLSWSGSREITVKLDRHLADRDLIRYKDSVAGIRILLEPGDLSPSGTN